MYQLRDPMPSLGRMMAFIDGENLVARYQAMLVGGRKPYDHIAYQRDVLVWLPGVIWPGLNVVLRATYYTYVIGNEEVVAATSTMIRKLTFVQYSVPGQSATSRLINTLTPRVFAKPKNRSGKGVDIQMTVDILSNIYQNNVDTVFIVSGDGDYEPVFSECRRMGKQVFLAALSSGLSPKLPLLADHFMDLDGQFFYPADTPD
ncbi:MAG TPA: NYN domain-containing protein [Burkholderiales bacterium]|nr:NYN domain-containing protein [Burkholderiales bacterium]